MISEAHLRWADAKAEVLYLLYLYNCSMWTLDWILYEPHQEATLVFAFENDP